MKNCRIESTTLGVEDHGIFTAYLHLHGEGWGCGFGGYALDTWSRSENRRVGIGYGIDFIHEILRTLEVESWEKLVGVYCRAEFDGNMIKRIGHITKDKWFDPQELLDKEAVV